VRVGTDATRNGDVGRKVPLDGARPFSAALHTERRRWILDLRGDLHAYSVIALEVQAQQFVGSTPIAVIFRLRHLRSIDEVGARCLVRLRETLEARGSPVRVTGAPAAILTVMATIGGERHATI
jgi:anti-anti-sigma regulatory factor